MRKTNEARNNRGMSGITLIALVITIIVLLILAGVSLSILDGNNGILIQAKKAASNYKNASEIEQIQMDYSALLIENEMETVTPEQLQQELVNNVQLDVTVEKKEMYYDA